MHEIHVLDLSVFCAFIQVPGMDLKYEEVFREFQELFGKQPMHLPVAVVYEASSIIATLAKQRPGDSVVAYAARRFEGFVRQAEAIPSFCGLFYNSLEEEKDNIQQWTESFSLHATSGVGLRELAVIEVYHKVCALNTGSRVRIWSHDPYMASHQR